MKKTWLSLALGFSLAVGVAAAASACPYNQTSASNDASAPPQTAASSTQPAQPAND